MLRSTTKKVRDKIRAYIMDDVKDNALENGLQAPANFKECALYVWEHFYIEKLMLDKRHDMTTYDYFTEWAQGLALDGLFLYFDNSSAVKLVGDWLEETEEERNKFSKNEAEKHATYLIWRELNKALPIWDFLHERNKNK